MRPHRSLEERANAEEIVARLGHIEPASPRQWGTMTPHEMLCHLADSFEGVMGDRAVSRADTVVSRTLVKWIALHTSLPWPHGVPTRPEVNPKANGTKPAEFERDRQKVLDLLRRFMSPGSRLVRHPGFGEMSRGEWMLWGYGHVDHHLRQFGV